MMNPEISFCIPFYSGKEFLKKAIESVFAQSFSHWELWIVDDAGPDGDLTEWLKNWNDPRIFYSRNEKNIGMGANWNRCLEKATAPLVTLLHADDFLHVDYAKEMKDLALLYPKAAAYYCGVQIVGPNGDKIFSFPDWYKAQITPKDPILDLKGEDALCSLLKGQYIFCPTLCYRKDKISPLKFSTELKQVLDLKFISEILLNGEQIVGISWKYLYFYRRHQNNATAVNSEKLLRFKEESEIFDWISSQAQSKNWLRASKKAKEKSIIKKHLCFAILKDALHGMFGKSSEKLQFLWNLR